MCHYFTDEAEGTRELINECIEGLDDSIKFEYIINCLVLKSRKDMTVKEIFCAELMARQEFEEKLKDAN